MPSYKDINNYWNDEFDLIESCPTCFICGINHGLEICHLIPKALGGKNEVNNLVLLCHNHHRQAPNIAVDKELMLHWIHSENQQYNLLFNFKNDTINNFKSSFYLLYLRLNKVCNNSYLTSDNINKFLKYSFLNISY